MMQTHTRVSEERRSLRFYARRMLIGWLWFGAISALAGGILGVVANGAGVPLGYLQDTPFASYLVPGLLLGIVIGGTQLIAALLLHWRHPYGLTAAAVAGFGMIVWIFVELAVISEYSPLQAIYLAVGVGELVLVLFALGLLRPFLHSHRPPLSQPTIRPWTVEER
jgi:hypothetical protein